MLLECGAGLDFRLEFSIYRIGHLCFGGRCHRNIEMDKWTYLLPTGFTVEKINLLIYITVNVQSFTWNSSLDCIISHARCLLVMVVAIFQLRVCSQWVADNGLFTDTDYRY